MSSAAGESHTSGMKQSAHTASLDYIQQTVSEANSEARLNGRKSFLIWQKLAPDNAQSLFMQFDYQSQKAIIEE